MAGHRRRKAVPPARRDEVRRQRITREYATADTPEQRLAVAYDWFRCALRRASRSRSRPAALGAAHALAQESAEAFMRMIERLDRGDAA